jgi:hypothetical protein
MSDDICQPDDKYWDLLLGQTKVSLTGASNAGLRAQLFDVLLEFFFGSNCWQEAIQVIVTADTVVYPITPLQGGRILRLLGVLDPNAVPQAAIMPEIGTVQFQYPYNNTITMSAIVVKTVTDPLKCDPPDIPDWILPTHERTLFHGLLGNMMMQPGMSYSNPQMANFHLVKFRDGIAGARVATTKANTIGAQTWAYPQQFRASSQRSGISTFNVHPVPRY